MTKKRSRSKQRPSKEPQQRALVWTERVVADLEAIGEYIARDNPAGAERWVSMLLALAESASRMPFAGRRVPEFEREEIRELLKKRYRLVYRITKERVEVLTVFEGHRRFPSVQSDPPERE